MTTLDATPVTPPMDTPRQRIDALWPLALALAKPMAKPERSIHAAVRPARRERPCFSWHIYASDGVDAITGYGATAEEAEIAFESMLVGHIARLQRMIYERGTRLREEADALRLRAYNLTLQTEGPCAAFRALPRRRFTVRHLPLDKSAPVAELSLGVNRHEAWLRILDEHPGSQLFEVTDEEPAARAP